MSITPKNFQHLFLYRNVHHNARALSQPPAPLKRIRVVHWTPGARNARQQNQNTTACAARYPHTTLMKVIPGVEGFAAAPAPVCVLLFALSYLALWTRLCKCSCTRLQKVLPFRRSSMLTRLLCCVPRRAVACSCCCSHFLASRVVTRALVMHNHNKIIFQPYFAALARALYGYHLLLCVCDNEIY